MGSSGSTEQKTQEAVAATLRSKVNCEWANGNNIEDLPSLRAALTKAGLESSNLIVAVDFTKSNDDQGAQTFGGRSLHALGCSGGNPYEQTIDLIGRALDGFDDDGRIPLLGFGDTTTRHFACETLGPPAGCAGVPEVLAEYRRTLQAPDFAKSGPTSFAPIVEEAIRLVEASGRQFHVLLIVGDGMVSSTLGCKEASAEAIVKAANYPLSIVFVGVGDGPWHDVESFDDGLPQRRFDNFQFVPFADFHSSLGATKPSAAAIEAAFAVYAMQEVPAQFKAIKSLGLLEPPSDAAVPAEPSPTTRALSPSARGALSVLGTRPRENALGDETGGGGGGAPPAKKPSHAAFVPSKPSHAFVASESSGVSLYLNSLCSN